MAARSRNQPRSRLAWLIVLALVVLVLVATRAAAAAPNLGEVYANALVGCAACAAGEGDAGDDDDDDGDGDDGAALAGEAVRSRGPDDDAADPTDPTDDVDRPDARDPADLDELERLTDREPGDAELDEAVVVDAEGVMHGDWLDDEALAAIDPGVTLASSALGDVVELSDVRSRRQRPSRFGRIDLSIAWRRAWTVSTQIRSDALWLVATWRR